METLLLLFNFFSVKYFLIFAVVMSILSSLIFFGKHYKTYNSEGFFFNIFVYFFLGFIFNALALAIVYLGTWFSKLERGTNLGYGEEWWYIIRWSLTGLIVVFYYFSDMSLYFKHASKKDEEALELRAKRRELIAEMLEIVDGAIKKVNKIEGSSLSNYKNKLDSYEKDYMDLINIIETEESALERLSLDHPRIRDLISSREVGDSKKFLEKKEKIFSEIDITDYKKIAKDRPFDESSIELLRAVDEYKEKLLDPMFPSLNIPIGVVMKGYEEVQERAKRIPKTYSEKKMLEDLLKKPIILGKEGKDAIDKVLPLFIDLELYRDLFITGQKNSKGDARDIVKKHMKRMGI